MSTFLVVSTLLRVLGPFAGLLQEPASMPELPEISLEGLDSAARSRVEEAYQNLQQEPKNPNLIGQLGMQLHAYEDLPAAEALYQRAHALDPKAVQWIYLLAVAELAQGKGGEALPHLKDALELNPNYDPAAIKLGEVLLDAGRAPESLPPFQRVLQHQPDSWLAHYGLGRALLAQGEAEAGIAHLEQASRAPGGFGAAHYSLALALRDLGRRDEAAKHLRLYQEYQNRWPPAGDRWVEKMRALKSGPREMLAEGVRLARQGRSEEAIQEHLRALEGDPSLVQARVNLIRLYGELKQYAQAERQYSLMLDHDSNQAEGHYNYGVILSSQGRLAEAEKAFRKAVELNPHFALGHNNLGFMLESRGRIAEAADHYREAVRNDPSYRLARFNLGRTLVASGALEEAIEQFQKTLTPDDQETPRYLYALSAAYVRAGKLSDARRYAEAAKAGAVRWGQPELEKAVSRDLERLARGADPP